MAKKNPKGFAILAIVVILLIGAGIGGYFAYRYVNPTVDFKLKGGKQVSVALDSTYKEKHLNFVQYITYNFNHNFICSLLTQQNPKFKEIIFVFINN